MVTRHVIEFRIQLVVEDPGDCWTPDQILFKYNESSHCLDTEFEDIARLIEAGHDPQRPHVGICRTCPVTEVTYLGQGEEFERNALDITPAAIRGCEISTP